MRGGTTVERVGMSVGRAFFRSRSGCFRCCGSEDTFVGLLWSASFRYRLSTVLAMPQKEILDVCIVRTQHWRYEVLPGAEEADISSFLRLNLDTNGRHLTLACINC